MKNSIQYILTSSARAFFIILPHAAIAADSMGNMDMSRPMTMPVSGAMSEGEVKKIDKDAGKITLKHGPLTNLQMPGMTMVFRVTDPKMLDQVKEGDMVKFNADKINGALTVTSIHANK